MSFYRMFQQIIVFGVKNPCIHLFLIIFPIMHSAVHYCTVSVTGFDDIFASILAPLRLCLCFVTQEMTMSWKRRPHSLKHFASLVRMSSWPSGTSSNCENLETKAILRQPGLLTGEKKLPLLVNSCLWLRSMSLFFSQINNWFRVEPRQPAKDCTRGPNWTTNLGLLLRYSDTSWTS